MGENQGQELGEAAIEKSIAYFRMIHAGSGLMAIISGSTFWHSATQLGRFIKGEYENSICSLEGVAPNFNVVFNGLEGDRLSLLNKVFGYMNTEVKLLENGTYYVSAIEETFPNLVSAAQKVCSSEVTDAIIVHGFTAFLSLGTAVLLGMIFIGGFSNNPDLNDA